MATVDRSNDMQINGSTWLSSLGGALISEIPLETYEAKSLPEHTWIEYAGVEVYPTSGILGASEIVFKIGMKGEGSAAVTNYRRLVNMLTGQFNTFTIPITGTSYGSLLFSKTGSPEMHRDPKTGDIDLIFDLTMRMTEPSAGSAGTSGSSGSGSTQSPSISGNVNTGTGSSGTGTGISGSIGTGSGSSASTGSGTASGTSSSVTAFPFTPITTNSSNQQQ